MSAHVVHNRCPHCGYVSDRAAQVGGEAAPDPGDVSMCAECGEWAVFGPDLNSRVPTDDEFAVIGEDPQCRAARRAWVAYRRRRSAAKGQPA